jgi:hypothetical protein
VYTEQAALRLLNIGGSDTPPVAACCYAHDFGKLPDTYCLRADPVHLQADTHGLVVFDARSAGISADESRALAAALVDHLALDGWELRYGDSCRWYLLGDPQDLTAPAICQVRGLHTRASVLEGGHSIEWTRRLNELQMLMATHPVNIQRQSDRRKTINSLWLWGGGKLTGSTPAFDAVVSENPALLGAATVSDVRVLNATSAAQLLGQMDAAESNCLVSLEHCRNPGAYVDCSSWNQALMQLEERWFAPLLSALSKRQLDYIELIPLNGSSYRLTRSNLRVFWRKAHDYREMPGFRQEAASRT